MTVKKNSEAATGMDAPAQNKINPLQARLAAAHALQTKVTNLQRYQVHEDFLKDSTIEDETAENADPDKDANNKIVLHFGYSRGDQYEIKNPALLADIRAFLLERIATRKSELEHEIITATI